MIKRIWRLIRKYYFKLVRTNDTPHAIALGLALGLFFGTAIPLGQMALAVVFAFIFRANKVVAFAVTWISNPYTSPFMYVIFCYTGSRILGRPLTVHEIKQAIQQILTSFSWLTIFEHAAYIILTYMVGGLIIGGIVSIIGYFISLHLIIRHRRRKER